MVLEDYGYPRMTKNDLFDGYEEHIYPKDDQIIYDDEQQEGNNYDTDENPLNVHHLMPRM